MERGPPLRVADADRCDVPTVCDFDFFERDRLDDCSCDDDTLADPLLSFDRLLVTLCDAEKSVEVEFLHIRNSDACEYGTSTTQRPSNRPPRKEGDPVIAGENPTIAPFAFVSSLTTMFEFWFAIHTNRPSNVPPANIMLATLVKPDGHVLNIFIEPIPPDDVSNWTTPFAKKGIKYRYLIPS